MKLYTAIDVENIASQMAEYYCDAIGDENVDSGKKFDEVIASIKPIELPSDEEIDKNAKDSWITYEYEEGNLYHTTYNGGFKNGAKWVIKQIKQQAKC